MCKVLPYFWSVALLLLLKKEGHSHTSPFEKKEWHSSFALNLGSGALLSLFSKNKSSQYQIIKEVAN
jgi:hypothetical protein